MHSSGRAPEVKAFIRRRAAEAVRENSETSRSAAGSASAATDPPPGTRPTPDRPAYVPSTIEAISTSVEQLPLTPGLRPLFTSGLTPVHKQAACRSTKVVSLAVDTLAEFARFREVQISRSKIDDLLPPPNARPSRAQRRRILLVDADGSIEAAGQVVAAHAAIHARRGLWVRTHLDDLRATTLRQFDTLFVRHVCRTPRPYPVCRPCAIRDRPEPPKLRFGYRCGERRSLYAYNDRIDLRLAIATAPSQPSYYPNEKNGSSPPTPMYAVG